MENQTARLLDEIKTLSRNFKAEVQKLKAAPQNIPDDELSIEHQIAHKGGKALAGIGGLIMFQERHGRGIKDTIKDINEILKASDHIYQFFLTNQIHPSARAWLDLREEIIEKVEELVATLPEQSIGR